MYAYFQCDDGEYYFRVPEAEAGLDWAATEVGSTRDGWQRFATGDEIVPQSDIAKLSQEIAQQRIAPDDLPSSLLEPAEQLA